ncbi:3-carboxy-cis,cis-muconate cycloisomerase [soil metagenome]
MSVFEAFLASDDALDAFDDAAVLDAMLRFEAGLAAVQAELGVIPADAGAVIASACDLGRFDVKGLVRASGRAGSLAIPLLQHLKVAVDAQRAGYSAWTHFGSTSQDVIDTAMVLCTQRVMAPLLDDLRQVVMALLELAERWCDTPLLARTLMQPASVTSFGLKALHWAAPLKESLPVLQACMRDALRLQLGGAVGTLAQMGGRGAEVAGRLATRLGLGTGELPWHVERARWVRLGAELGVMVGSLGKIALDISLMAQFEVAEAAEPVEPGRGGSSAMPHKRNPVASMIALAAAARVPGLVGSMLSCMPQQHERALGTWQAELAVWPALVTAAHGSVHAMAGMLPSLVIDADRMRANIMRLRSALPREAADEWFDPALAAGLRTEVLDRAALWRRSIEQ